MSELQRTMAAESLSLIALDGDEHLLDIGCGDGYVTAQIADRLPGGTILGVDPSPRMIEAARQRATTATFQLGEVCSLTFDAEFDVVTSFNALHWVHDQPEAYRHIANTLRPGGRALVTFVCDGPRPSVEDVAMDVTRDARWGAMFDGFIKPFVHPTPEGFAATVSAAGSEVLEQAVVDQSWNFGSRDAFAQWCAVGFGDWSARLAPDAAAQFVDDVVDRYAEVTGRADLFAFYQLRARLRRL
ncbi:MAG: class I SAM-dependent methyltransferase [Mycobacterium sp.]